MKSARLDLGHAAAGPGRLLLGDFDQSVVEAFFKGNEKAASRIAEHFGDFANEHSSEKWDKAPFDIGESFVGDDQAPESYDFGTDENSAFAKPAHAGKGNTDTSTSDGTVTNVKGGGNGRDKNIATGETDTSPTPDTTTEPAPTPDPEPTPEPIVQVDPAPVPLGGNYVSGLDTPGGYNIEVEFIGGWTDDYKTSLINVVEMISDIVIGDIPSYNGHDDFYLKAVINAIDGTGGYLGVGGTLVERPDGSLPSDGYFRFDEADIANSFSKGNFEDVIFHEVLHSMGFGTIWNDLGLVENIGGATRFTGALATDMYNTEFASIAAGDAGSQYGVPLSSDGSHWDHQVFTKETMTTSLYSSGNYVSDMTIAALQDMGYETIMADEFLLA